MNANRPKIMVVDDDEAMLFSVTELLDDAGYDVCGVEDGYQALERAAEEDFALVFMDINMPGMDGVEAHRKLKAVSPDTVVIMMTGFSVETLVEQALNQGAYTVLYKPLDIGLLMSEVQNILGKSCVLVVDDEPDNRESARMILEDCGYDVAMAANGNQAVAQVAKQHFDVVMMDVGMPGMDAFEACRRIVEADPDTKVIFVTAHDLEVYAKQALQAGAFSLLCKPVEPDDLLTLVGAIIGLGENEIAAPLPATDNSMDNSITGYPARQKSRWPGS